MSLLIGLLTFILVLNCLFLMLLVLIQLPKKEAGAGVAFGGGATDALFGAGSGNALTKLTKYTATSFLGLALVLSVLHSYKSQRGRSLLEEELLRKANQPPAVAPALPTNQIVPPAVTTPQTTLPAENPAVAPAPTPTQPTNLLQPAPLETPAPTPAPETPAETPETTPAPVPAPNPAP